MTTDNKRPSSAPASTSGVYPTPKHKGQNREHSEYLPQRDLPMPTYEFLTPSQSPAGSLRSPSGDDSTVRAARTPASLRNFSVRAPAFD